HRVPNPLGHEDAGACEQAEVLRRNRIQCRRCGQNQNWNLASRTMALPVRAVSLSWSDVHLRLSEPGGPATASQPKSARQSASEAGQQRPQDGQFRAFAGLVFAKNVLRKGCQRSAGLGRAVLLLACSLTSVYFANVKPSVMHRVGQLCGAKILDSVDRLTDRSQLGCCGSIPPQGMLMMLLDEDEERVNEEQEKDQLPEDNSQRDSSLRDELYEAVVSLLDGGKTPAPPQSSDRSRQRIRSGRSILRAPSPPTIFRRQLAASILSPSPFVRLAEPHLETPLVDPVALATHLRRRLSPPEDSSALGRFVVASNNLCFGLLVQTMFDRNNNYQQQQQTSEPAHRSAKLDYSHSERCCQAELKCEPAHHKRLRLLSRTSNQFYVTRAYAQKDTLREHSSMLTGLTAGPEAAAVALRSQGCAVQIQWLTAPDRSVARPAAGEALMFDPLQLGLLNNQRCFRLRLRCTFCICWDSINSRLGDCGARSCCCTRARVLRVAASAVCWPNHWSNSSSSSSRRCSAKSSLEVFWLNGRLLLMCLLLV
uniref:SUN domain-containing protein n=1 Tax=Macrostomum lignano TaxID=282301 RepID=A0A1I8JRY5_9PLAT